MSEYTPDTHTLRVRYVQYAMRYLPLVEKGGEPNPTEINLEFGRWLVQRDAEVAAAERERIVSSIEDRIAWCQTGHALVEELAGLYTALRLIKGKKQ